MDIISQKDNRLIQELEKRILVLDGAMGTMIQNARLSEGDYRGDIYKNHSCDLMGNNDILSLTRPDVINQIHTAYISAGADIVTTNTFGATSITQSDYSTENDIYKMNYESACLAKKAVSNFIQKNPNEIKFVAGTLGPTNKTLSISPKVEDPGYRDLAFDDMVSAYSTAVEGLIDGRVDLIIVETVFDTLCCKAALFAIQNMQKQKNKKIPILVSATVSNLNGRTLSGQTIEAFWYSVKHADLFCVGLNCGFGADKYKQHITELSSLTDTFVSLHPNAGLPDENGLYNESPDELASAIREYASDGLVNIVGGCCGTSPEHIKAIADTVKNISPRVAPKKDNYCHLSGLDSLVIRPDSLFVNIGERTNVAGSAKFKKLIQNENYEKALSVARQQVSAGAQIIDIGMDSPLLDSKAAMVKFLNLISSDPDICKVPIMIDSSNWDVIEAGLKSIQGRGIVNSISLKDGEEEFNRRAQLIKQYGAIVIVMAFDEKGQAVTYKQKIDVCSRAYNILVDKVGFPPEDIIFDPNVLTIATGMKEHNSYAVDFIEACKEIKKRLPFSLVSGGISNLSFAFRGNNTIRKAMHSVFLYHTIKAGMDMGIVNPSQLTLIEDVPTDFRKLVEDVVLNRDSSAADRLVEKASEQKGVKNKKTKDLTWRESPIEKRLVYSIINGTIDYLDIDIPKALDKYSNPVQIVEDVLMSGMSKVGDYFGSGKMFLPQVIKSARVMKQAVDLLSPYLPKADTGGMAVSGKVLLATVKGDVHDIGKNITRIIMECNNYQIIDLGVMVPTDKIVDKAIIENVDVIGLSGLVSPSLDEMVTIVKELEKRKVKIPVLIGGATTSKIHTAVKIAPEYSGAVVYVPDASRSIEVLSNLKNENKNTVYVNNIKSEYTHLRKKRINKQTKTELISLIEARKNRFVIDWGKYTPPIPKELGVKHIDNIEICTLVPLIDWDEFYRIFDLKKNIRANGKSELSRNQLKEDAIGIINKIEKENILQPGAIVGLFPANTKDDDIVIYKNEAIADSISTLPCLRQQRQKTGNNYNFSLSDFIAPKDSGVNDYIGAFVATVGSGADELYNQYVENGDEYSGILMKIIADRLVEALANYLHKEVETKLWGYNKSAENDFELIGIRPALGYPSCPDHSEKEKLFDILNVSDTLNVKLSENYFLIPTASVCGWYFSNPESKYFAVGRIGEDQLKDYSDRKDVDIDSISKWLGYNLF
ncbi:MAG: methionine synthase [candidate division Zixibacteria bacterium]|nr:methionine synthase [candidate division Zixibacteria bacterium]